MNESWLRKTNWTLCALSATVFALLSSGCAAPNLSGPSENPQVPAAWKEKQSPSANAFSKKVQTYLQKVTNYYAAIPQFTTPSQAQSIKEKP